MPTNNTIKDSLLSAKPLYLLSISGFIYLLIYFYHGFVAFGGDTIESVPYALWMSDHSLFQNDFHISHLKDIFPNERWLISWVLHWFPNKIFACSLFFHASFSIILIAGLVRFADLILKNIEWSVLVVFLTLFTLYNINTGSNELYYNMFVASLAGKAVGIWSLVYFYQKKYLLSALVLALTSVLHPLVGIQLFALMVGVLLLVKIFKWEELSWKSIASFILLFVFTGGIWIAFILGAQGPKVGGSTHLFFDIVEFRIAHHFFPAYFPKSHVFIMAGLTSIGLFQFYKRSKILFSFFVTAILGIVVYLVGIQLEWELVLSTQWMKVTIWLKFFSVIALFQLVQKLVEKKYHRLIFMGGFAIALLLAIMRFQPKYDRVAPEEMYAWIMSETSNEDVFLVPPSLSDFKAKTKRSSYFDFKAMLHHQPEIFEWASRFEEVYGIKIGERGIGEDIFGKVRNAYAAGAEIFENEKVNYFIIPNEERYIPLVDRFKKAGKKPLFLGEDHIIYGQKESSN